MDLWKIESPLLPKKKCGFLSGHISFCTQQTKNPRRGARSVTQTINILWNQGSLYETNPNNARFASTSIPNKHGSRICWPATNGSPNNVVSYKALPVGCKLDVRHVYIKNLATNKVVTVQTFISCQISYVVTVEHPSLFHVSTVEYFKLSKRVM